MKQENIFCKERLFFIGILSTILTLSTPQCIKTIQTKPITNISLQQNNSLTEKGLNILKAAAQISNKVNLEKTRQTEKQNQITKHPVKIKKSFTEPMPMSAMEAGLGMQWQSGWQFTETKKEEQ